MGMWTTENQNTLEEVLEQFGQAVEQRFAEDGGGSYFEIGYLKNTLLHYMKFMPKRVQKVLISEMIEATQRQESIVIEQKSQVKV